MDKKTHISTHIFTLTPLMNNPMNRLLFEEPKNAQKLDEIDCTSKSKIILQIFLATSILILQFLCSMFSVKDLRYTMRFYLTVLLYEQIVFDNLQNKRSSYDWRCRQPEHYHEKRP